MENAPLEAREASERAAEARDRFVSRLAILISLLAVFAAVAANLESIESHRSLAAATEATLEQDQATDAWSEYQADSIKRHLYTVATSEFPSHADKYAKSAADQEHKQAAVRARALAAEAARRRALAESDEYESRHHWLTGAATAFEIAIALATVSIITRRHWLWMGSALLGGAGAVLLAVAFA
jgi:methylmalonyl-CoA mutase N-terminal domain/subunit